MLNNHRGIFQHIQEPVWKAKLAVHHITPAAEILNLDSLIIVEEGAGKAFSIKTL